MSVCIITKNAERTLNQCLSVLAPFDDIVILDSGSTDNTALIAASFGVRFIEGDWLGFGKQKNACIHLAKHDWVFSVDADEVASKTLINAIESIDLANTSTTYAVMRTNHLLKKKIRFSGWQNDWVTRVFNRKITQFLDLPVHESVIPTGSTQRLRGELAHYPYLDPSDLSAKTEHYARLAHSQLVATGFESEAKWVSLLRASWAFTRPFFFNLGFLDGRAGLAIAKMGAKYTFLKYQGRS